MDWNDLRYFLAIARTGTLVRAGRELGVEHTTVSRRLSALETALGARLFTRGPDGLTLTPAGQDVLPSAEAMLAQADTIVRLVKGGDGRIDGVVRLTIAESINTYMTQELAPLRERHPELMVELLSDNRELDLRRGEADVAVRFRDVSDPGLVVRKLGIAGWSLYASPAYVERKGLPASAFDMRGHDVLGFDHSLQKAEGAIWLRNHGDGANVVLRGNSISMVQSAAGVGLGIAPLPCLVAGRDPQLVRLTPDVVGARDILLVAHPDLVRVARVRALMDFLSELFARDAALWSGAVA